MRLRWAKGISTFFRSLIDTTYCLVLAPLVHVNKRVLRPGRAVDVAGNLAGVFVFFAGDRAGDPYSANTVLLMGRLGRPTSALATSLRRCQLGRGLDQNSCDGTVSMNGLLDKRY
jgi:hypothetical protein